MTAVSSENMTPQPFMQTTIGALLRAILLNSCLFGIVSQQFYSYWRSDFDDSKGIKAFVVTQFSIIAFQSIMCVFLFPAPSPCRPTDRIIRLWEFAWRAFVVHFVTIVNPNEYTWRVPVSSVCECILVLFANIFLANRIYSLTKSRFQYGLIIALSSSAFVLGMSTTTITWGQTLKPSFIVDETLTPQSKGMAATWHGLQAISECLITIFLARALLKSRSGIRNSDTVVNYLIRNVIQIGFLTTLWAIGELVTWFFLPKSAIYSVFCATTGSLYTHLIYDTLLSRVQLRQHLSETTHTEMATRVRHLSRLYFHNTLKERSSYGSIHTPSKSDERRLSPSFLVVLFPSPGPQT
ncbi:hypothetical protein BC827DRAFT_1246602 [Russula dissimulans]|nr:hypothetical protein BC827DRAFT_1246602 [Russula dissimulans]